MYGFQTHLKILYLYKSIANAIFKKGKFKQIFKKAFLAASSYANQCF